MCKYNRNIPVTPYYTVLHCTVLYCTLLYYTILYYTVLYYTILYYTVLYYTIIYYTIVYYTILYYTMLYYTIRPQHVNINDVIIINLPPIPKYENSKGREMASLMWAIAIVYIRFQATGRQHRGCIIPQAVNTV
jgi:hypothetical protein